jgi:hypothetical protein
MKERKKDKCETGKGKTKKVVKKEKDRKKI